MKTSLKWLGLTVLSYAFTFLAFIVGPLLPLFAVMRDGPGDNANTTVYGPRLPTWLFWFDTTTDNSLWGDAGWREKHCPLYWATYRGMVGWLWRNPAAGFSWGPLAWLVAADETFTVTSSGCGLDLDKSRNAAGWFLIKSSRGAFHLRWVKTFGRLQLSFEAGWLLDIYAKDPTAYLRQPKAPLLGEPHLSVKEPQNAA